MNTITIDHVEYITGTRLPVSEIRRIARENTTNVVMHVQKYARDNGYVLEPLTIQRVLGDNEQAA